MGDKRHCANIKKQDIYELYVNKGETMQDVANYFSCSISKVSYWMRRYGIPRRDRIESRRISVSSGRKLPLAGRKRSPLSDNDKERLREVALKRGLNARGFSIKKNGYVEITKGEHKGRREHIVIMEQHIGRKLFPNEVVHHINGNKSDNRIENLQLMTASQHSALHITRRIQRGENINHFINKHGEDHPLAKITEQEAYSIKHSTEPISILMARYGISKSAIKHIRSGYTWKHLK